MVLIEALKSKKKKQNKDLQKVQTKIFVYY